MIVLGKNAYVFDAIPYRTCDVLPFDPGLGVSEKVPIVDAAVAYDCPFTHKTFILVFRDALHVKSLDHNLMPPFILREAGLVVNEAAKMHCQEPTKRDHAIIAEEYDLLIPLQLNGIFSYFHTRKPSNDDIENGVIIPFTPDTAEWDPYSNNFEAQEESMTDWNGEINPHPRKRTRTEPTLYDWDIYEHDIE